MILIGRKIGMTQLFEESGKVVPVSVIEAALRSSGEDPRKRLLGDPDSFRGRRRASKADRPLQEGGVAPRRVLREVRVDDATRSRSGIRST
jgi:large subunit ribosomal protein L3